jgi:hypothetical protein
MQQTLAVPWVAAGRSLWNALNCSRIQPAQKNINTYTAELAVFIQIRSSEYYRLDGHTSLAR